MKTKAKLHKADACSRCKTRPRAVKKIYFEGRLYEEKKMSLCYRDLIRARNYAREYARNNRRRRLA